MRVAAISCGLLLLVSASRAHAQAAAPVTVLVVRSPGDDKIITSLRAELVSYRFHVIESTPRGASRGQALSVSARARGAQAALRVDASKGAVELWVEASVGDIEQGSEELVGGPNLRPDLLAVRVTEAMRARGLALPSPPPSAASASVHATRVEPATVGSTETAAGEAGARAPDESATPPTVTAAEPSSHGLEPVAGGGAPTPTAANPAAPTTPTTATTKPTPAAATTKPTPIAATATPTPTAATTKPSPTTATARPTPTAATTKPTPITATTKPSPTTATARPTPTAATTKPKLAARKASPPKAPSSTRRAVKPAAPSETKPAATIPPTPASEAAVANSGVQPMAALVYAEVGPAGVFSPGARGLGPAFDVWVDVRVQPYRTTSVSAFLLGPLMQTPIERAGIGTATVQMLALGGSADLHVPVHPLELSVGIGAAALLSWVKGTPAEPPPNISPHAQSFRTAVFLARAAVAYQLTPQLRIAARAIIGVGVPELTIHFPDTSNVWSSGRPLLIATLGLELALPWQR